MSIHTLGPQPVNRPIHLGTSTPGNQAKLANTCERQLSKQVSGTQQLLIMHKAMRIRSETRLVSVYLAHQRTTPVEFIMRPSRGKVGRNSCGRNRSSEPVQSAML